MTHQFGHLGLDVVVEDVPPLLEVLLGVSLQRSGQGLTLGIELDVPRLRSTDEVDDLHLVAVAEMFKAFHSSVKKIPKTLFQPVGEIIWDNNTPTMPL